MGWVVRTLPDRYADSVRLMGIARALRGRDGVAACEVAMGTPANLAALAELGAPAQATPGDVVIAVDGEREPAEAALAEAERMLAAGAGDGAGAPGAGAAPARPRSLGSAVAALGAGANLALISVAGEYATLEAHRALTRGLHVFLFSDHVSVADEIALKRRGAERGLLVMGPGCGTAMLGGVGLGFCNVVPRGPVGIVAAAGTGAQEVACLIAAAGGGVSQIVGVGGRDLSAGVGAAMPDVSDLERAVDERRDRAAGRHVLGLFSGGSLAHEATVILEHAVGPVAGNVSGRDRDGHRVLDLGEEEYTQGRPHPMVDLDLRRAMIDDAAGDDTFGCLLLDVVLGHGAHPDPAGELAGAVERFAARGGLVLARVCGTDDDPQDARRQTATLEQAGALVAPSNAAAARLAVRAVRGA